jgi:hypothetical protein
MLCNSCLRNQRRAQELYARYTATGRNCAALAGALGISKQAVNRIILRVERGLPSSCQHLATADVMASESPLDTHAQVTALLGTWGRPAMAWLPASRWAEHAKRAHHAAQELRLCRTCGWPVPCERCP